MNIELDKNYRLTSDGERNVVLQKKNEKKKYSTVGYYSTVENAFQGYAQKRIIQSDAETIQELLDEIRDLREYLESVLEVSK